MHCFSLPSLTLLALIPSVFASSNAPPQAASLKQGITLRPINIADYEASMGLQRRSANDFSVLEPQNQTDLVYGSPASNGKFLLANMTLYAQNGLPIVLLEGFEELNVSVDCRDEKGILSLTFGSMDAFDYARKQWDYVNDADDGKFLLIANHDGCGPDDQRQPYIVSNITDDTSTLTTYLIAQAVPWSTVAGSYDLDFGHPIPTPRSPQIQGRSLFHDAKNAAKGLLNATEGDVDKSTSETYPISAGQQDQRENVFTDSKAGLTVDCTNCFIHGSLEVTGHISSNDFHLEDFILTASPNPLLAALELEAIITANYGPDRLGYVKHFPSVPFPDLGFYIPGIMNIGPTLTFSVGVNCTFGGSAVVDFGVKATVPDSAQIVADYKNHAASTAMEFEGGQLTPTFDIKNCSASVTLSAFSELGIDFGVELVKIGTLDIAMTVKLPEVIATITALYDEQGACSQNATASKTGVQLDSTLNIEVDLGLDGKLEDLGSPWSMPLYNHSTPLYSRCYPLNIPGLLPTANATNVTSLPSTSTASSGRSALPFPTPGLGNNFKIILNETNGTAPEQASPLFHVVGPSETPISSAVEG